MIFKGVVVIGQHLARQHVGHIQTTSRNSKTHRCLESGRFAIDAMLELIRSDLALLGVEQEVFASERALVEAGGVDAALKTLEDQGLIYTGVLEPPKGKLPDDWEERPQLLFKATEFGDDIDRPLRKSDESWTYFASDIAYHRDKFRRGFDLIIDVQGADHFAQFPFVTAAISRLGCNPEAVELVMRCLVRRDDLECVSWTLALAEADEPVGRALRALDQKASLIRIPGDRSASLRAALRQASGDGETLDQANAELHRLTTPVSLDKTVGDDGSHYPAAEKVVQEFWDYDDADREKARRLSDEYLKRRLQELKDGKRNVRTWKEN